MQINQPEVEIVVVDGEAFTTSLDIARRFERSHKNVLQAIQNLEFPPELAEKAWLNFQPATYQHPVNKQTFPVYRITRDGFALLAMGFTGKKALEWKLKYIAAFNAMEAKLRAEAEAQAQIGQSSGMSSEMVMTMARQMVRLEETMQAHDEYAEAQGEFLHGLLLVATMLKTSVDQLHTVINEMADARATHLLGQGQRPAGLLTPGTAH
jgi:Rha family phage regulatory protein